jgi:hypothetical protein
VGNCKLGWRVWRSQRFRSVGFSERWYQTLKNRVLLENYHPPGDLKAKIATFVNHYNHRRYHENLNNLTPADVYFGRASKSCANEKGDGDERLWQDCVGHSQNFENQVSARHGFEEVLKSLWLQTGEDHKSGENQQEKGNLGEYEANHYRNRSK